MPTPPLSKTVHGPHFVRATALARKGHYAEALTALQTAFAEGDCTEAQALDLKARIHAQQGYGLVAESCWERARKLDPGNPSYDRALAHLRKRQRPGTRFARIGAAVVALCLAAFLFRAHFFLIPAQQRQLATLENLALTNRDALHAEAKENDAARASTAQMFAELKSQLSALQAAEQRSEQSHAAAISTASTKLEATIHRELQATLPPDAFAKIRSDIAALDQRTKEQTQQLTSMRQFAAEQFDVVLFLLIPAPQPITPETIQP